MSKCLLTYYIILVFTTSCNYDETINVNFVIKKEHLKKGKNKNLILLNNFLYDNKVLGNRYLFYSNSLIKEYSFQNDEINSSFLVKFDSSSNSVLSMQGNPLVYTFFELNDKKDSLKISGIISMIISDSSKITIKNNSLKNDKLLVFEKMLNVSEFLKVFKSTIPAIGDTIDVNIDIRSLSKKFGDSIYTNNFSFAKN